MQYIEYIQNGSTSALTTGWHIPLNYHPTSRTDVMMRCKIDVNNSSNYFNGDILIGAKGGNGNFFRFFGYQNNRMTFDCPNDGNARVNTNYTGMTEWEISCINKVVTLKNRTANLTTTASTNLTITWNEDWCVWNNSVVNGTRVYYIEIYEAGVLVKDFRPAIDNNNVVCLYEKLGGTYHYNSGNTLIGGPFLSSISVIPSSTSIKASGGTFSLEVSCQNAWTLSTSGDSFLTFSSTGDTSGVTITASASSYSGVTDMLEYLTFTDTVTGDIAELTIKQKKYVSGQPVYLGSNEVTELYLGSVSISEAYLGTELVYSSGPFVGLKVSPKSIVFKSTVLESKIKIKSSEPWTMTVPAWITAESLTGDTGTTEIGLTATTQVSAVSATVAVVTNSFSASCDVDYKLGYGIPANEIWYATSNNNRITSWGRAKVYDTSGVDMTSSGDFSTYGKVVYPRNIGCTTDSWYDVNSTNNLMYITEIGLPEMVPAMCTAASGAPFGSYTSSKMNNFTRIYGDYPYINEDENACWSVDGSVTTVARGYTGKIVLPEGVNSLRYYACSKASCSAIEFPTTFTGNTNDNGYALTAYCLEDTSSISELKFKTMNEPSRQSNWDSRFSQNLTAYIPAGGNYTGIKAQKPNWTYIEY